jgi:ADP-heptose:LPS heptosyltransferase
MSLTSVVVVKPSSLGDIVHTLPAVHSLKSTFPEAKISWIANTEWTPLLDGNADVTTVIPFPRKEFRGALGILRFFRWCRSLSGLAPDLVLDFQGLFRSAWMARSAKGKSVYGLSDSREASRFYYDKRACVRSDQHSVLRYLALAHLAGANISGPVQFPLPDGKSIGSVELPRPFVALHPFARGPGKSLTPAEITEFTRLLAPIPVVIVGRSDADFETHQNVLSVVNRTDLAELIWVLRQARFIVSVDSGPMHIAAALSSELVAIHTWSNPRLVGPYNPDAWIWKDRRLFQVRSIDTEKFRETTDDRPDLAQIASFVRNRLLH